MGGESGLQSTGLKVLRILSNGSQQEYDLNSAGGTALA